MTFIQSVIQFLAKVLKWDMHPRDFTELEYLPMPDKDTDGGQILEPVAPDLTPTGVPAPERLYNVAKSLLGQKLGDSVDPSNACAESVSNVLIKAGYFNPKIPTVNGLIQWMLANGFKEVITPTLGSVITAHSVNLLNTEGAHVGICGADWIMSNSSYSDPSKGLVAGTFQANYTYPNWLKYFGSLGSKTRYFLPT